MNPGDRKVAMSREEPSPSGSQAHPALPLLTQGGPMAAGAVGADAVSLARLVLTGEAVPSSGVSMRSHSLRQ